MASYTKPQQWKKEESERLRGGGDQIKFVDLSYERWQVVGLRKARRRQDVPKYQIPEECKTQKINKSIKFKPHYFCS